ncbi:SGO1 protein, partial [Odontophorus gujanensis]|nr:SGO1 protein [Odontophorus gujanensis]
MAERLKKSFKDSLSDIKERMKEKRNQKWVTLGKMCQISTVKRKRATTSSVKMKSLQANNKALAQALQEEKLKLRDAQAVILQQRKEYQDLKFHMFDLQRSLALSQAQGLETRLSALSDIISKVSQKLLESVDLLGPAQDLCSRGANQRVLTSVLENISSDAGKGSSVELLQPADGHDRVLQCSLEADCEKSELGHSTLKICQEPDNGISSTKIIPDKGQTSDFHVYNTASVLGNISSSGKNGFGNVLTKNASTRRCCLKMAKIDELSTDVLDHFEAPDSDKEPFKQDEVRLEERLDVFTTENIHSGISQVDKVGSELVLRQMDSATAEVSSGNSLGLKQRARKSREDSQVKRENNQKVKVGGTKDTSRPSSKKRRDKETLKEKLNSVSGSSDAYDFNFEESVHVTPFRQNKVNGKDTDVDGNKESSDSNNSELSDTEGDSDDSLYVPYKSTKRSSADKMDTSPVHVRPRSKRCLAQRELKLHEEETAKETESNKSSKKSARQPAKSIHSRLCDVTNIASSFLSNGNAPAGPAGERPPSPKRKRRSCTLTVSYKEPSIAGKLRRGDPFTDMCFLSSPVFKQKKNGKHNSTRKKSLSKYNEKFVGRC